MGITLKDIYEQRDMLRRGEEIARAAKQAAERERLRDTFAAAALTGWFARPAPTGTFDHSAAKCYEMADAMLRERGNHSEKPNSSTNHDAAPAATATADRYVRRAAADGDSDRTDKAAQRPSEGTGDTPVTNPKPKEKLAEVSDGSYRKTDENRGSCDTCRDEVAPLRDARTNDATSTRCGTRKIRSIA